VNSDGDHYLYFVQIYLVIYQFDNLLFAVETSEAACSSQAVVCLFFYCPIISVTVVLMYNI